jgi:SAM-dependent methyltransferase
VTLNLGHLAEEWARGFLRDPGQYFAARTPRHCTVCSYEGRFMSGPGRRERRCPNCGSRERDRIIGLHLRRTGLTVAGRRVLHLAPEASFYRQWRGTPGYIAADLARTRTSERRVDITAIDFPDASFDLIICNHVLEHVPDDRRGIGELFRVLAPGGTAIVSVPIEPDRQATWTPPADMPKAEVERLCGYGHLRLYGRDFEDLLRAVGFAAHAVAFTPQENDLHRLADEIVHVCRKVA